MYAVHKIFNGTLEVRFRFENAYAKIEEMLMFIMLM